MHDKHYNIEEPYDAKVSSTVLEPSREGRPSLLRQPRDCCLSKHGVFQDL
jgi:hypothetical protein